MWDVPVRVNELVLAPAERADVLVDGHRHVIASSRSNVPSCIAGPAGDLAA
jgi:hypothetical protein